MLKSKGSCRQIVPLSRSKRKGVSLPSKPATTAAPALALGSSKRALPLVIELHVISFLSLTDAEKLFWLSKALNALVKRYLAQLKRLRYFPACAAGLIVRFCRQLHEIDLNCAPGSSSSLLCRIIANNQVTLRKCPSSFDEYNKHLTPSVAAELVRAPLLETFEFRLWYKCKERLPASVIQALASEALPHLRSLAVDANTLSHDDTLSVLRRGNASGVSFRRFHTQSQISVGKASVSIPLRWPSCPSSSGAVSATSRRSTLVSKLRLTRPSQCRSRRLSLRCPPSQTSACASVVTSNWRTSCFASCGCCPAWPSSKSIRHISDGISLVQHLHSARFQRSSRPS